jgi:hypothetical protein
MLAAPFDGLVNPYWASVVSGGVLGVPGCLACAVLLPSFRAYDAEA